MRTTGLALAVIHITVQPTQVFILPFLGIDYLKINYNFNFLFSHRMSCPSTFTDTDSTTLHDVWGSPDDIR